MNEAGGGGASDPVADTARGVIDGAYVALVSVDDDHVRRRVYFSLQAAERAAERARRAGLDAVVVLAELRVVSGVS